MFAVVKYSTDRVSMQNTRHKGGKNTTSIISEVTKNSSKTDIFRVNTNFFSSDTIHNELF